MEGESTIQGYRNFGAETDGGLAIYLIEVKPTSLWINQPHWRRADLNLNQSTSLKLRWPQFESINLIEVDPTLI